MLQAAAVHEPLVQARKQPSEPLPALVSALNASKKSPLYPTTAHADLVAEEADAFNLHFPFIDRKIKITAQPLVNSTQPVASFGVSK